MNHDLAALTDPQPGDHCLLCGASPSIIGVFKPDDPGAWGGMEGKSRFFRYCLCSKCQGKTDSRDRIEKVIMSELNAGEGPHHEV